MKIGSQSGLSLVEAMLSVAALATVFYAYSDSVKKTFTLDKKAETKYLYTVGRTVLDNEISKQISSFIFGPMQCGSVGDPADFGLITSVPDFMATRGFRVTTDPLVVSGMELSREEADFDNLRDLSGSPISLASIPSDNYQAAHSICSENLMETLDISNNEFRFCVYMQPVLENKNIHPYIPMFAIVNVTLQEISTGNVLDCSDFIIEADSNSSVRRESVGGAVKYTMYWGGYRGENFSKFSSSYVVNAPKSHIMFKTLAYNLSGGDINGLVGADRICQENAATAGIDKRFKAILSDSRTNAIDRVRLFGKIISIDGTVIADSPAEFWSGEHASLGYEFLTSAADDEEVGGSGADDYAWTGTNANGLKYSDDEPLNYCDNWTSDTGSAQQGQLLTRPSSGSANVRVHSVGLETCNTGMTLLCVSQ